MNNTLTICSEHCNCNDKTTLDNCCVVYNITIKYPFDVISRSDKNRTKRLICFQNDLEFAKVFILFHGLLFAGCCNGYRRISFVSQHFSADSIRISATKGKNVSP